MKIGPERPRLSERLNSEPIQPEPHMPAVSTDWALKRFAADCERLSSDALNIISADMAEAVITSRRAASEMSAAIRADLNIVRQVTRFSPWVVALSLTLGISTTIGIAWHWSQLVETRASKNAMIEVGLTPYQSGKRQILLMDPSKLELKTCQIASQKAVCLVAIGPQSSSTASLWPQR
jgi:hypothetical protein